MVLSNGKRGRSEIRAMFKADITDDFKRLFALNLLIDISKEAINSENMSATGTFRTSAVNNFPFSTEYRETTGFGALASADSRPLFQRSQPQSAPAPMATPAAQRPKPVASGTPTTRRSMAAAKMYMIDILQRMRDMDSPAFAVAIQTSTDEADLARNLVNAIRFIYRKSGGTFGARVFEKLYETLPEMYLLEMEHLAVELAESPQ
ncbi:MAG: hypothetical protein HC858_10090 [Brachymonas sp.]|nr:hypothetical protein [Brachymonas sp.]